MQRIDPRFVSFMNCESFTFVQGDSHVCEQGFIIDSAGCNRKCFCCVTSLFKKIVKFEVIELKLMSISVKPFSARGFA